MDDNLHSGTSKKVNRPRRSYNNLDNGTFNSTSNINNNGLIPKPNQLEYNYFQRRTRNEDYFEESEYDTPNLALNHTPSSDTLHSSRNSRNAHTSHRSPRGSFRILPNFADPNLRPIRKDTDGVNMLMLIGFAIGICFGTLFNILGICLKSCLEQIEKIQLHVFNGKSFQNFYLHENSFAMKLAYSPLCLIFMFVQNILWMAICCINYSMKPAPKTLVSNVMMPYINE